MEKRGREDPVYVRFWMERGNAKEILFDAAAKVVM